MKTPVFTKYHIAAGAKMAEFAGYNMPIEFTGINDEHMAVRNGAGVFDVSHMGEIWVKGPRALDLLQRITTNDVSKLYDGKVQYTCMPNGRGGIVDDILVYRVDAETYMLCVNAANIEKDWNHICEQGRAFGMEAGHGKELYNASDEICQLAVQGPLAMKIVQKMCDEPVEEMEYYTFKKMKVAGCDAIRSDSRISVWARAIRCVWRRASASTATTSTTPPRRSKADWAGSPNSPRARSSSTAPCWRSRRPRA